MTYEIIRHIATLSTHRDMNGNRRAKELNIISWSGKDCVLDIREWSEDHTLCGRGLTLTADEVENLIKGYSEYKTTMEV